MRRDRKRPLSGAYETLSDIAMGSLGVFIVLVVVIVIISTYSFSEDSNPYSSIIDANEYYESQSKKVKQDFREYKALDSANTEIEKLKNDFELSKRKLSKKLKDLKKEEKSLSDSENKFDEVQSVLNVITQTKKEKAQFLVEMKKLNAQLESLIDKQTGHGVDRTGRPNIKFTVCWNEEKTDYAYTGNNIDEGIKTSFVLIGEELKGINYQNEQFIALLKALGHEGENSLFVSQQDLEFRNCYKDIGSFCQDVDDWFLDYIKRETTWRCTKDVKRKEGY